MIKTKNITDRIAKLSLEKRALLELDRRHQRATKEDIAIIGMACRFPQARNIDAYWALLKSGTDAIIETPADRWDLSVFYDKNVMAPGKTYSRWGGYLDHVDLFDPGFFEISPHETIFMDPQQRLCLETVWEAFEDAGQPPDTLAETKTSVFIGISSNDYGQLQFKEPYHIDAYANTGNSYSIVANRISYLFNLWGPSLSVDTACSSSLVAVHLACQSLWSHESTCAIVGGVNIILTPALTIGFSKLNMLSPDGRCRAFDAEANGYVRGEGAGFVILKPLSAALNDGNQIYAVIRGSAANQDGRSNGLTAPNRIAQERVCKDAYADAHLAPYQVHYVETHGTGTLLGDQIEASALGNVLALDRPLNSYCMLGSVKSNIGHLESAAGMASLIKTALSIKHRELPPSLHIKKLNPYIPFRKLPLKVQRTLTPWPGNPSDACIAGVSSFGFGGTNAHVVLGEAPLESRKRTEEKRPNDPDKKEEDKDSTALLSTLKTQGSQKQSLHLLTLSAKNEKALKDLVGRYLDYLYTHPCVSISNMCYTASLGRSHFAHRIALIAEDSGEIQEKLTHFIEDKGSPETLTGHVHKKGSQKIAFLFTGEDAHYSGMGRGLYETQPLFRKQIDRCTEILNACLEVPLVSVMLGEGMDPSLLDRPLYAEPGLFAFEYSLAALWRSWGILPEVVMGHGLGEYVAACIAGVFSLEDGLQLIAERARLMETLSHNEKMDSMLGEFEQAAKKIEFKSPTLPLISNLTGKCSNAAEPLDASYWRKHVRAPVKFPQSMMTLFEMGYTTFIEIGPQSTLLNKGKQYEIRSESSAVEKHWLPSLKKDAKGWHPLLHSLSHLYVKGADVQWRNFFHKHEYRQIISLPTYPFQRKRYWIGEQISKSNKRPANDEIDDVPCVQDPGTLYYKIKWQQKEREQTSPPSEKKDTGFYLIFADGQGFAEQVAASLEDRSEKLFFIYSGKKFASIHSSSYQVNPADVSCFSEMITAITHETKNLSCRGILHCWNLDAENSDRATATSLNKDHVLGSQSIVHFLQTILADGGDIARAKLWVITQKAQCVHEVDVLSVGQSVVWGLKVIALEHAPSWGGLIDIDKVDGFNANASIQEILNSSHENQIAFRNGKRFVPRLNTYDFAPSTTPPLSFKADATYVITGGGGGIGLVVARWMIERGAQHLLLIGRTKLPARSTWSQEIEKGNMHANRLKAITELQALGATIDYASVDVSNKRSLTSFFQTFQRKTRPPIRGVFHAAGRLKDHAIVNMNKEDWSCVIRPKILGAWNLHHIFNKKPLDYFVLFSSVTSVLG